MGKGLTPLYQNDRPDFSLTRGPQQFVEDQVEQAPEAPALVVSRQIISYRELNSRSNQLAHFLRKQGAGPGSLVGVYLDRCIDSIISLLAILKCGAVYLPLDPKFPKDRLQFMVADSEASFLLAHSSRLRSIPQSSARLLLLDRESESIAQSPIENLALSREALETAYVIYTSGSTGKPKGVMIPRRALVNFLLSMAETPGIGAADTLLSVTPSSFDISILEFLLPLTRGAQIVMASAEQASDSREIQKLLIEHAVTVMQATPATWRMLVESGWEGKRDLRILCGGEALTQDLARQLLPLCSELWNMYGPTETTIWSSVERHDALRACFDVAGRIMRINPAQIIPIPVTDLSTVPSATDQEQSLRDLLARETVLPFPLPAGPLFRSQIILLAHDRAAVVLTVHHVICDGWSLDVLSHDLCALYSEELTGVTASLGPVESYFAYTRNVVDRESSDEFAQASTYWHNQFAGGFPVLVLPTDRERTARREFKARRIDNSVPPAVVAGLRSVAAKQGCSFFSVLLGSLAIFLARVSRQRRFVIALPTAEQPVSGQPNLVGHCVNLLPFEVELREGEAVNAFLKRIHTNLVAAQEHAIYTMASLLEDLRPVPHLTGISPISAGFTNATKFKPGELSQSGFTVDYDANPKAFESFELYLNAVESEQNLDLHCHYDIKLFEDFTIRQWLSLLASILRDVAADPQRGVINLAQLGSYDSSPEAEIVYAHFSASKSEPLPLPPNPPSASAKSEPDLLQALLPLWRRVLDTREIGPDDDFFALGGNSIVAAQLFAIIQRELGYAPSLAVLYDASTPRQLAKILSRGNRKEDWKSLVAINRLGSRPPLFLVHAAEGNVLLYRSLAARLGADQPVYGLQSVGLDGRTPVDPLFEHVARRYIEEIRQIQPHGPYMLGGYCLGGTIALEMAQQLIASGETVGLVALIEDYNIRAMQWPLPWRHHWINRLFLNPYFHLHNVFNAEGSGKLDFFSEKLLVEIRRAKVSMRGAWVSLRHRLSPNGDAPAPRAKLADLYEDALVQYDVRPYPGVLTLILAERHLAGFDVSSGGWKEIALGGLQIHSLPFSPRGSLVEPYVGQLARILQDCLDR